MQVDTVAESLLFTTVRIETVTAAGVGGTGTGFLFSYVDGGQTYPFLVTNKHVVAGAARGWITLHKANASTPALGATHRVDYADFGSAWFGHPDPDVDVAVLPWAQVLESLQARGEFPFCRFVDRAVTGTSELYSQLDALEEVVFIGYPNGIWDSANFLPIMRRGTTATPISVDFQGKKQFLIDASVFPGSSGSPVFLFDRGVFTNRSGNATVGTRLAFLGVVASVFFQQDVNEIRLVPQPTADVPVAIARQMIDLGVVFKAETVTETIEALLRNFGVGLAASTAV